MCLKEGLFGVCGRAAELGSFAFDNASEMPLASELFVLKYLEIVTEALLSNLLQNKKKKGVPAIALI